MIALPRISGPVALVGALLLAATTTVVIAQADDSAPAQQQLIDDSGSFEVGGVNVDVTGKTADDARYAGWRLAQRKGWQMLSARLGGGGGNLSDGALDGIVSGIVVENEQIGPNRYVARLGVLFSRVRAGAILGVAGEAVRSPPMLVIPIEQTGGTRIGFEQHNDWGDAWSRFRAGGSAIDYVRPAGTGPDALLLNAGQIGRPGRGWWRTILDQYGARDVVVPTVRLFRQWPGGPIVGIFEARHGPDNRTLGRFSLRVGNEDALPVLLDAGVKRLDDLYQQALRNGLMGVDMGLAWRPTPTPTPTPTNTAAADALTNAVNAVAVGGTAITLQVDTPTAGSVSAAESALRGTPGVNSATTTSLAIGGLSIMRLTFDGDPALLRSELETRGWSVEGSGTTLRIRRRTGGAPGVAPGDNATG